MRIGGSIKLGDTEVTVNDIATKVNSIVQHTQVTNLNLNAGDTYQLSLPKNTLFIEPLVASAGSQYSGGQIVIPGAAFTYITNNDKASSETSYKGIWVTCNTSGLVTISSFRHCGCTVKGFRIWYINI